MSWRLLNQTRLIMSSCVRLPFDSLLIFLLNYYLPLCHCFYSSFLVTLYATILALSLCVSLVLGLTHSCLLDVQMNTFMYIKCMWRWWRWRRRSLFMECVILFGWFVCSFVRWFGRWCGTCMPNVYLIFSVFLNKQNEQCIAKVDSIIYTSSNMKITTDQTIWKCVDDTYRIENTHTHTHPKHTEAKKIFGVESKFPGSEIIIHTIFTRKEENKKKKLSLSLAQWFEFKCF